MTSPPKPDPAENGRELPDYLVGDDPSETLERLIQDDPLGIESRCSRRVDSTAYLVDPFRVAARSLARIAFDASAFGMTGSTFGRWVEEKIDDSILSIVEEEAFAVARGMATEDGESEEYYAHVGEQLDTEPWFTRRLCAVFNRYGEDVRKPLYAVLIQNVDVEEYAMRTDTPLDDLQKLLVESIYEMVCIAREGEERQEGNP